jgi:hypothetical protein
MNAAAIASSRCATGITARHSAADRTARATAIMGTRSAGVTARCVATTAATEMNAAAAAMTAAAPGRMPTAATTAVAAPTMTLCQGSASTAQQHAQHAGGCPDASTLDTHDCHSP